MSVIVVKKSGGSYSISTTTVPIRTNIVHTGRDSKSTRFVAKAGNASATMNVIETGLGLYYQTNNPVIESAASNTSSTFIIQTNAYKLKFYKRGSEYGYDDNDALTLTSCISQIGGTTSVQQLITYNDTEQCWEVTISGDPGKDVMYILKCTFTYNPNQNISLKTYSVYTEFFDENGNAASRGASLRIKHAAGSAYVYWGLSSDDNITNAQATMAQNGNPITTYVMSNTSWTISEV